MCRSTKNCDSHFYQTELEIEAWLKAMGIQYYTIEKDNNFNPDNPAGFVVRTRADVILQQKSLNFLPVQFSWVGGDFDISYNHLVSLKGSPMWVGTNFSCQHNKLESLEFGPQKVGIHYNCSNNQLTSLKHGPTFTYGLFDCSNNLLTSLEHGPEKVCSGYYQASYNPRLTSLKGSPYKVLGDLMLYECGITSIKALQELPHNFYITGIFSLHNENADIQGLGAHLKDNTLMVNLETLQIIRENYFLKHQSFNQDNNWQYNHSVNKTDLPENFVKNKKNVKI